MKSRLLASKLIAMASLMAMASNLIAMASNLVAMASTLIAMASTCFIMFSYVFKTTWLEGIEQMLGKAFGSFLCDWGACQIANAHTSADLNDH